jgi:hypothetical protein
MVRTRLVILAPAVPALIGLATAIAVFAQGGGYFVTDWYPGGLVLLGLLVLAVVAIPSQRRPPRAILLAIGLLAGYALWSFLSIGWADQQGMAWDGANRTLLYVVVFALFAWRPLPAWVAGGAIAILAAAVVAIGLFELVHLLQAADPKPRFIGGRLASPTGYPNANAVLWTMGLFVFAAFACVRTLPSPVRGLLFGGAILLGGLALMGQSRGWLFLLPAGLLVFVALAPDPGRALVALAFAAAGVLAVRSPILDIHASLATGDSFKAAVHHGCHALLVAAAVGAVVGTVLAEVDRRMGLPWRAYAHSGRIVLASGVGVALLAAAVFAVASGDPSGKLSNAWDEFKGGQKHETAQSRFSAGLGSNRYDFWRVGVNAFREHPIGGLGADNFQQYYLRHRRSSEQPLYPHSVEVRTLAETGLVGTLLLGVALVAVFLAAIGGGMRWRTRESATYAAAAVAAGAWFLIEGSLDWFWEYAGIGVLAFALLGLAAALRPPRREPEGVLAARLPPPVRVAVVGVAAALIAISFALPWLAEREVQDAAKIWPTRSAEAYDGLDRAASLNPLSSRPDSIAGTIAFRLGDVPRARTEFGQALERDGNYSYAALELGLSEALLGDRAKALQHLELAHRSDPNDPISEAALALVRKGKRPDVTAINALILNRARDRLK